MRQRRGGGRERERETETGEAIFKMRDCGKKRIFQTEPFVAKRENCEVMMLSQGRQKFKKKIKKN